MAVADLGMRKVGISRSAFGATLRARILLHERVGEVTELRLGETLVRADGTDECRCVR